MRTAYEFCSRDLDALGALVVAGLPQAGVDGIDPFLGRPWNADHVGELADRRQAAAERRFPRGEILVQLRGVTE